MVLRHFVLRCLYIFFLFYFINIWVFIYENQWHHQSDFLFILWRRLSNAECGITIFKTVSLHRLIDNIMLLHMTHRQLNTAFYILQFKNVLNASFSSYIMEGDFSFCVLIILQYGLFRFVSLVMLFHIVSLYKSPIIPINLSKNIILGARFILRTLDIVGTCVASPQCGSSCACRGCWGRPTPSRTPRTWS